MSQSVTNALKQFRFKKNVAAISNTENSENKSKGMCKGRTKLEVIVLPTMPK